MERRHPMTAVMVLMAILCCAQLILIGPALGDQLPFPEPANENAYAVPIETIRMRVWAQYRVMYNASNIPSGINSGSLPSAGSGPGRLNFGDTTGYDMFRQRMRLAFDIRPKDSDNVGGYLQMEYRGGFGGPSPAASDPRGESGANADGTPNAFIVSRRAVCVMDISMSPPSKTTPWSSEFSPRLTRSDECSGTASGTSSSAARHWAENSATVTIVSDSIGLPRI